MARVWMYIAKRVIALCVVLFLIATLVFVQFFVRPGDSARLFIPKGSNDGLKWMIVSDLRLNESLASQYVNFMTKVFTGKFFISTTVWKGASIADGLREFLPTTLIMYGVVLASAGLLGGISGLRTTRARERKLVSKTVRLAALVAVSTPGAVLAMLLWHSTPVVYYDGYGPSFLGNLVRGLMVIAPAFISGWGTLVLMEKGKDKYFNSLGRILDGRSGQTGAPFEPVGASAMTKMFASWSLFTLLVSDAILGGDGLGRVLGGSVRSLDFPLQMSCIVVVAFIAAFTNFILDMIALFAKKRLSEKLPAKSAPAEIAAGAGHENGPSVPAFFSIAGPRSFMKSFLGIRLGVCALVILLAFTVLAIVSPSISTVDDVWNDREPNRIATPGGSWDNWINPLPPSLEESPYTGFVHPFGTDIHGYDVFSHTIQGTRGALIIATLLAIVSLIAGFLTWTVLLALKRSRMIFDTILSGSASVVSDAALTIPVLAVLFLAPVMTEPTGWSSVYPLAAWSALFSFAIVVKSSRSIVPKAQGAGSSLLIQFSRTVPSTIYASKYVVVGVFIGMFTFEALVGSGFWGVEATWGQTIGSAIDFAAVETGAWWWYTFPTLLTVTFLASVYVLLDNLETTARLRWGTLEAEA